MPTTTEKPVPAVGFDPLFTEVIVSVLAPATETVTLRSGELEIVPSETCTEAVSTL